MPLTLTIRNVELLDNGSPGSIVLDGRGATIGRGATADWCLPDPSRHVSSRHCEIVASEGGYELVDTSTNGTYLLGQTARLPGAHLLSDGDVFVVGKYEIAVTLDNLSATPSGPSSKAPPGDAPEALAAPAPPSGAAAPEPAPRPTSDASPLQPPPPRPVVADAGSEGSSAVRGGGAGDVWGQFEASNAIDWERGGFGASGPADASQPSAGGLAEPEATPLAVRPAAASDIAPFLAAAGLSPGELKQGEAEAMGQAGMLLRRLIAGMVLMLEARARAKSQMGAAGTGLELAGNNPLKFARTPEQAIAMMLNPVERGFMPADKAVEDSFRDLQAHQMATLKAMQGALRVTLDRFSPKAIRGRATVGGFLARIFPPMRDAQLWRAYEREFSGVAYGSDEAFMDIFAKEFRRAYEDEARQS